MDHSDHGREVNEKNHSSGITKSNKRERNEVENKRGN
jgi:hypothetical protein